MQGMSHARDRLPPDRTCELLDSLRLAHADRAPESLVELVPDYLDELPDDPSSGEPLKYRPGKNGPVIYPVGPGKNDDGGQPIGNGGAGDALPNNPV